MIAILLMAVFGIPACATEDSPACVWDASEHGNGVGYDVLNLPNGEYVRLPF